MKIPTLLIVNYLTKLKIKQKNIAFLQKIKTKMIQIHVIITKKQIDVIPENINDLINNL